MARAEQGIGAELDTEDRVPDHVEHARHAEHEHAEHRPLVAGRDRGSPGRRVRSVARDSAEDHRRARGKARVERSVPDRPERVGKAVAVRPAIPVQAGAEPRRRRDHEPVELHTELGHAQHGGRARGGDGRHHTYIRVAASARCDSSQRVASRGSRKRWTARWANSGRASASAKRRRRPRCVRTANHSNGSRVKNALRTVSRLPVPGQSSARSRIRATIRRKSRDRTSGSG